MYKGHPNLTELNIVRALLPVGTWLGVAEIRNLCEIPLYTGDLLLMELKKLVVLGVLKSKGGWQEGRQFQVCLTGRLT